MAESGGGGGGGGLGSSLINAINKNKFDH